MKTLVNKIEYKKQNKIHFKIGITCIESNEFLNYVIDLLRIEHIFSSHTGGIWACDMHGMHI